MLSAIQSYNNSQPMEDKSICDLLMKIIDKGLPGAEARVWHAHPVWFLNDNPVVGYSIQKRGVRLMFWSGADFEEQQLNVLGKKFRDASVFYNKVTEINTKNLQRWLAKSIRIQWDYKNIVKRKGQLERVTV